MNYIFRSEGQFINFEKDVVVLTSILMDPLQAEAIFDIMKPEYFLSTTNQAIFSAMVFLREENKAIDLSSLRDKLYEMGKLNEIGDEAMLVYLFTRPASCGSGIAQAKHLRQHYIFERINAINTEVAERVKELSTISLKLLDYASEKSVELQESCSMLPIVSAQSLMQETFARYKTDQLARRESFSTGIASLDDMINGFSPGEIVLLAGELGSGTTTLALDIGVTISRPFSEITTLAVLLGRSRFEMSMQLTRFFYIVDPAHPEPRDIGEMENRYIHEASLFCCGDTVQTLDEITAMARKFHRQSYFNFMLLDPLQFVRLRQDEENSKQDWETILQRLKSLARELEIAILCTLQVPPDRDEDMPQVSAFGALKRMGMTESADIILYLRRTGGVIEVRIGPEMERAEVHVLKHPLWPSSSYAKLVWCPGLMRFQDYHEDMEFDPEANSDDEPTTTMYEGNDDYYDHYFESDDEVPF